MSIEETEQAAPLLQTLGDPAAAVCVDGFCAVPETGTDTANTSATSTSATSTSAASTSAASTSAADTGATSTRGAGT